MEENTRTHYKGTKEECIAYNNYVNEQKGYIPPNLNWANVKEIEGNFYVIKHPSYDIEELELNFDLELSELPKIIEENDIL
jgi:hypothetical protein